MIISITELHGDYLQAALAGEVLEETLPAGSEDSQEEAEDLEVVEVLGVGRW